MAESLQTAQAEPVSPWSSAASAPDAQGTVAPIGDGMPGAAAWPMDAPSLPIDGEATLRDLGAAAPMLSGGASAGGEAVEHGFLFFIAQSDWVGQSLFGILVVMSLLSWYIIIVKGLTHVGMRRRSRQFLQRFWQAGSLEAVVQQLQVYGARDPFSHLTQSALQAQDHHKRFGVAKLEDAGTESEFVTRTMRKVIDEETARLENGLTVLASIGSTAPFVGLFGTVWGVYHALVAIGMGGNATIDRIAGPVGEALIMTGLGLAVAIPAVLGFNALVRRNRVLLARLDAFAYDLFTVLTTGQRVTPTPLVGIPGRQAA